MTFRLGRHNDSGTAAIVVGHSEQPPVFVRDTTTTESEEGFHGFADSEVPRYVFDDFSTVDLKTPFKVSDINYYC